MLRKQMLTKCLTIFLMAFLCFPAIAQSQSAEEEQQEESFSEPVEKLTGRMGDVPVYSHIYGANFMTEQERCNYLLKLDGMKTKQERATFRAKHHEAIDLKRKEKGG